MTTPAEGYINHALTLLKMARTSDSFVRLSPTIQYSVREFLRSVRRDDDDIANQPERMSPEQLEASLLFPGNRRKDL